MRNVIVATMVMIVAITETAYNTSIPLGTAVGLPVSLRLNRAIFNSNITALLLMLLPPI